MDDSRWQRMVQAEYHETDDQFLRDVLPIGSVDSSSFGLIADATHYRLVQEGDTVHIRPQVAELKGIIKSLNQGGMSVDPDDAKASVHQFAELWEAQIRAAGKWDDVIAAAREAGEIGEPADLDLGSSEDEAGLLDRFKRLLFGE